MKKIFKLEDLKKKIHNLKLLKKKIILCHGVFDLLHIGHIKYFEEARSNGDILIVSVTSDKYVKKGINRPYFSELIRAEAISFLKFVDYLIINNSMTAIDLIKQLKPDFYVKGPDYKDKKLDVTGNIYREEKAAKKVNCKVLYTQSKMYSSTKLINNFFEKDQSNQFGFIKKIKSQTNQKKMFNLFDKIKKIKILLIGDAILDEYIFAEALNKSAKEAILTFSIKKKQKYLGGSLAIANNLAEFCKTVNLISITGDNRNENSFIDKNLKKNVKKFFLRSKNNNTILKSRIINEYDNQKQIGLYNLMDMKLSDTEEKKIIKKINKLRNKIDFIIISDFGHGIITNKVLSALKKINKKISINSQINSTNIGKHTLQKFKNLDFMTLNYFELKHELRENTLSLKDLTKKLCRQLKLKKIFVTNGSKGSIVYNRKLNSFFEAPGLNNVVKDRIGAGDSFFSLASLSCSVNAKDSESIFFSSLASYFNLQNFANEQSLDSIELKKAIVYSLK